MPWYRMAISQAINGKDYAAGERIELSEKRGEWLRAQRVVVRDGEPAPKAAATAPALLRPPRPRRCCGW